MPSVAPSAASLKQAERLLQTMRPQVAAALERLGGRGKPVTFNDIESEGASVGDLLARTIMLEVFQQQAPPTGDELDAARKEALAQADPQLASAYRPEDLVVKRIPDKPCTVTTLRGAVPYSREYLYYPALGTGVFPPRPAAGPSRG